MKNDIRRAVLSSLLIANLAVAQEAPRFTETIDVSLVNVEVIVTDRNGERVRGLEPEDFTILEDGKPQAIVNFAEYASDARESVAVEGPQRERAAEPPPRQRRTFLIWVDEVALAAAKEDFRPALAGVVRKVLQPGDTGALLSWTNRLNVRQGFTGDVAALETAVNALRAPGPVFSVDGALAMASDEEAFWRSVALDPRNAGMMRGSNNGLTGQLINQSFATTAYLDTKTKVRVINTAMTAMAGVEGRKVLLLVTHRFSRHAGREYMLDLRYDSSGAPPRAPWLDQLRLIESVADTANATGFTVYGLYPEGLRSSMDTAETIGMPAASAGPIGARDHVILMNETESLELVSERTGGEYAFGSDALKLLPRVADDLTDYYSVAYRKNNRGTDNRRKISVRVKNRDYEVRARSEIAERSDSTRMRDRVSASVFAEIDPGVIPIRVEFGPQPKGGDTWPLKVKIPISALTTTLENGTRAGAFTVYVAWNNQAGTVSDTTRRTQRFTIDAKDLERANESHFTYNLDVRIDHRTKALGVGVLDETSKEYGVVTVPLVNTVVNTTT